MSVCNFTFYLASILGNGGSLDQCPVAFDRSNALDLVRTLKKYIICIFLKLFYSAGVCLTWIKIINYFTI